jgi:hypothetical protein
MLSKESPALATDLEYRRRRIFAVPDIGSPSRRRAFAELYESWLAHPRSTISGMLQSFSEGQWITYNVHNGHQYIILEMAYRLFCIFF